MPIYEYECQKCHRVSEFFQKITEAPKRKCPQCGGALKKLISLGGFALKGGGWYKDGYSSKKVDEPKKEAKTETKTEPKTEAKSATAKSTKNSPSTS